MKPNLRIAVPALFAFLLPLISYCSPQTDPLPSGGKPITSDRLVGTWRKGGGGKTIQFFADGTYVGRLDRGAERGVYTVTNGRLTITPKENDTGYKVPEATTWEGSAMADKLTLTGTVDGEKITMLLYLEAPR